MQIHIFPKDFGHFTSPDGTILAPIFDSFLIFFRTLPKFIQNVIENSIFGKGRLRVGPRHSGLRVFNMILVEIGRFLGAWAPEAAQK